jgi:hypothetical protein
MPVLRPQRVPLAHRGTGANDIVAEREGFEPSVPTRSTTVFETVPIDRSGTSPT